MAILAQATVEPLTGYRAGLLTHSRFRAWSVTVTGRLHLLAPALPPEVYTIHAATEAQAGYEGIRRYTEARTPRARIDG